MIGYLFRFLSFGFGFLFLCFALRRGCLVIGVIVVLTKSTAVCNSSANTVYVHQMLDTVYYKYLHAVLSSSLFIFANGKLRYIEQMQSSVETVLSKENTLH